MCVVCLVEQVAGFGERVVSVRVANEFVLLEEREGLLLLGRFEPAAQVPEGVLPVDAGFAGRFVDTFRGVFAFERE